MPQPIGADDPEADGLDSESPIVLSDHDRRYQFTAPDDPPRYGLIVAIAGALIGLILLTIMIANIADPSSGDDDDSTVAGPDATQLQQTTEDRQSVAGVQDGPTNDTFPAGKSTPDLNEDLNSNEVPDDAISVPSLLGKPQSELGDTLASLGISFSTVEKPSDTFTKGTVIGTVPEAGQMIAAGSTLTVYISSGPSKLIVPEVVGVEAPVAVARLSDAGLTSKLVEVPSTTAEAGVVVGANPSVGTEVADGTVVELSVSSGTSEVDCVDVPNVIGQKAPIATGLLAQAGFTVETKQVAHSAAVNTVVGTTPAAGFCADPGSTSTMSVSCASDIIPNVVGLPVDLLSVAGFTVEKVPVQNDSVPAGTVLGTTPVGGTQHCQSVPVAARVAGASTEPVCDLVMPNVVGLSAPVAELRAAALGLTYSESLSPHPTVNEGVIVSSDPVAGAAVCAGARIGVVVSSGPPVPEPATCTITVPVISLKPEQEVVATLTSLGLVASTFNQPHNAVPAGFVSGWTSDRPVANGQFCAGDRIFVTVSTGP